MARGTLRWRSRQLEECDYAHERCLDMWAPGHSCASGAMELTGEMKVRSSGHFWEYGYPQPQSPSSSKWAKAGKFHVLRAGY